MLFPWEKRKKVTFSEHETSVNYAFGVFHQSKIIRAEKIK